MKGHRDPQEGGTFVGATTRCGWRNMPSWKVAQRATTRRDPPPAPGPGGGRRVSPLPCPSIQKRAQLLWVNDNVSLGVGGMRQVQAFIYLDRTRLAHKFLQQFCWENGVVVILTPNFEGTGDLAEGGDLRAIVMVAPYAVQWKVGGVKKVLIQ